MSVQAISWVLESSRSQGNGRLVLISIANHADRHGRGAFPSQETISRESGCAVRTVRRAILELRALGELLWVPLAGEGLRRRTHLYWIPPLVDAANVSPFPDGLEPENRPNATAEPAKRDRQMRPPVADEPKEEPSLTGKDGPAAPPPDPVPWEEWPNVEAELDRIGGRFPEFPVDQLRDPAFWRDLDALTTDKDVYYLEELEKYVEWWLLKPKPKRRRNVRRSFATWIREEIGRAEWRRRKDARKAR